MNCTGHTVSLVLIACFTSMLVAPPGPASNRLPTFDGGQYMTSNTGCISVLTQQGVSFNQYSIGTATTYPGNVIVSGYTQSYVGYTQDVNGLTYLCFQAASWSNQSGFSLYLSSDATAIQPGVWTAPLTEEAGAPLTYGDKQWGARADGTTMDGTQNGDTFVWPATTSFADGSTVSLSLNFITENTRVRHCRGGRGFTCWYTYNMIPYLQGGNGTFFFPVTP